MKSYENGLPIDGNNEFIAETVWGKVSRQNSLTYAFENAANARPMQDVGLDGLKTMRNSRFLRITSILTSCGKTIFISPCRNAEQSFSPMNDPAGDNIISFVLHIMTKNSRIFLNATNTTTGGRNSLSPDQSDNPLYQSARAVPDVEDINQDNTLNEYERYFQYKVSIRPGRP